MRRSFTLSYIVLGDLFLLVWFGLHTPNDLYTLATSTILFAIASLVMLVMLVRAHWTFVEGPGLTTAECALTSVVTAAAAAIWWLIFSAVLSLMGADLFDV